MKKRIGLFLLISNMVLVLAGCGNSIPDMSDEQMDAVGEYAAIMLMKYDANHRSRLVDLSKYEEEVKEDVSEPQPEEEEGSIPENDISGPEIIEPQVPEYASMEDFMELPAGVTVTYEGLRICDSYPEEEAANEYFYLEASGDKKLVVLRFTVSNMSAEQQQLDFWNSGNTYKLKMGDTYMRNALTTMLLDDMVSFVGALDAGCSKSLVLLFEAESEFANETQEMNLILKNESKTYTIQAN